MEEIDVEVSFSEYINDAVRILVLLNAIKERKSVKMTESKIKLYDYFLKFPCTMLSDDIQELSERWNFDEYYAFFHWQPDLIRYRQNLNYLISKGFIEKVMDDNTVVYKIEGLGTEALNRIENPYKRKLVDLANDFIPKVLKLSESKIEQQIREKSNIFLRNGGIKHES
jgi:hypothetical protein